ncbi:MAG: SDR family oxidoreductase [Candidatus Omnitrophica bacterium]|nr:SDR family oxidoreductase [Candidatus Omnitrophota bacterium]
MFQNKTFFITGGTGALGSELVRYAIKHKARVFFTYHSNYKKASELQALGAQAIPCNLASPKTIQPLLAFCAEHIRSIDVLINNCAIVRDHTIWNMTEEEWDDVITVNIKAIVRLTYGVLPLIKKGTLKKVFNIISRVGLHGAFGQANYAASKDALIEFTKILAVEWADYGIAVNGINPGFMESAMTNVIPEKAKEEHKNKSLFKIFSSPAEVANFIGYLSSSDRTRISGQILHYETRM